MRFDNSIRYFEMRFREQALRSDRQLNPFELLAIPHLRGLVLDYGCGMGNLAFVAAARGCSKTLTPWSRSVCSCFSTALPHSRPWQI